ncbi:hypothetical protein [Caproiciproducens faecalis]|uniref:Uncharacterized protein n=1 Tax=Caproiciproducens faecalis TaxID=2820301 RepID=A0ABS7DRG3_9FIRM|nr:hypothetical protein [Caproiciproducens faecalis]MBW7573897.1 hypothetical protein [Caproiciproducens faecalis]
MTLEEIERHAMRNDPLPTGLNQAEQLLFLSFRCMYKSYRSGTVDREQAQAEKRELIRAYEESQRWIEIYKDSHRIRVALAGYSKEVEAGTCERCKKMMRIFDGRQIEP